MGMFDMLKNAKDLMEQASMGQKAAMASQQAAAQPVNLNDPMWAPIEGVTLDLYAEISAGLMKNTVMGPEAVAKYAESKGVPSGGWQKVQNGWVARMGTNEPVRVRFGNLYNEFLK
ncbi:hypothetical protein A3J90_03960 [candidate division WOR-1 bacterium RIFOXYC2_FULL_37_10]|uniref:Uncharacterized protein n=1 Tax=candidate division WOR-1 bacterium RIFOXYB2_FULL_37_13 TaxID=1802579 RepID=A0A1F4SHA8_UNCSA|nr:MAG: hypothetical protein A2310_05705 [candidate division WOR-1 bacterium RIFOXYB2_FULL_37_13]OGC32925.1 MAG: hypothetical protein A3J90_03960 [candidate division WOR-1 bacterium RIFOXYC2_FULL_37_10]